LDALSLTRRIESTAVNTFRLTPTPPLFVRGEGPFLYTEEGERYVDLVCGSATTVLGHGHPAQTQAISDALASGILHTGTRLPSPWRAALYRRLVEILPPHLDAVHLANSGAEAIETCLKAAIFATGRRRFIAFEGGYHGRTLGALALTHSGKLRAPFEPWDRPWVDFAPYASTDAEAPAALAALDAILASSGPCAAVVIEAVQGVSGVRGPSATFLQGVAARAARHGALLIVDEIWSGLGRSGRWFAFEHADLRPDLVALGKGLSASLPLSAAVGRGDLLRRWPPGSHTSTFQGNPLACAAAEATLRTLRDERLVERGASEIEPWMRTAFGHLEGVRVVGAQMAIDLGSRERCMEVQRRALEDERILVYGGGISGEALMILPPLNIPQDVLLDALARLKALIPG
jgi:acetylornithine/succinyldiaminopimelate/putrescine aminotransferase